MKKHLTYLVNEVCKLTFLHHTERTQSETVSVKEHKSGSSNVLQPKSGGRLESTSTVRLDAPSTNAFKNRLDKFWKEDMGI